MNYLFLKSAAFTIRVALKNYDAFKQKHGLSIRDVEQFDVLDRFRNWIMHLSREEIKVKTDSIDSERDYNHYLFKQLIEFKNLKDY